MSDVIKSSNQLTATKARAYSDFDPNTFIAPRFKADGTEIEEPAIMSKKRDSVGTLLAEGTKIPTPWSKHVYGQEERPDTRSRMT